MSYSYSNAILFGLTKSLAINLSSNGIQINTFPPTYRKCYIEAHATRWGSRLQESILMHRVWKTRRNAVAGDFLMSPEDSYMIGTTINIDDGPSLK